MRHILGINFWGHDSSAALIKDGTVAFAAAEERFSREKKDWRFPQKAIQAALDSVSIEFEELDAIAFGLNRPGSVALHTLKSSLTGKVARSWAKSAVADVARELYQGNGRRALENAFGSVDGRKIHYIDHHESHAWSAYAMSGIDEALVMVMDGRGSHQGTSIYRGQGGKLKRLKVFEWPNSLGTFYQSFTDLLGFDRNSDEWKVMGLAAYGQPTVSLEDCIQVNETGYEVNGSLLSGKSLFDLSFMTPRFGPRRKPEIGIAQEDMDLAASVQKATEDAIFATVREGVRLTGIRDLCLAGGVALNSKANGKLLASGIVDRIFVQPAAADDGTAIGSALGAFAAKGEPVPTSRMEHVFLGNEACDADIQRDLAAFKIHGRYCPNVEEETARLLAEGGIVGWFQGRMEFGPRALGGRSILADPRRPETRDRVNESVKFREGWRPFAPSVLAEAAPEYFENCNDAPFMLLTFNVRPEKREVIPAVTHVDNTARVQTVEQAVNPRYWNLIHEFARLTAVPVLLNTSFNLRGEPIVSTPKDAIRTFFSSGLDHLVLGNFIVSKSASDSN